MKNTPSNVIELTSETAPNLIAKSPFLLIVDFYAEWCGPCKTLKPIFEDLSNEFKDRYVFAKINIDNCREIAQHYEVISIPTTIIFSNGQIIEKIIGLVSKEVLLEKIEQATKGPQDLSTLSVEDLNKKLLQTLQTSSSTEEVKRILDAGANVNTKDANGLTPLMAVLFIHAARGIDVTSLIQLLLSHGASTEFDDERNGKTMQASELVTMMSNNYKKLAENYDNIAKLLTKSNSSQTAQCTEGNCKI